MIIQEDVTNHTGFIERMVTEDGKIELGIYPVLFGYRLRAGYVGDYMVMIDWCFAQNLDLLYHVKEKLEVYIDSHPKNTFKELPSCSYIKPVYKDEKFMKEISELLQLEV